MLLRLGTAVEELLKLRFKVRHIPVQEEAKEAQVKQIQAYRHPTQVTPPHDFERGEVDQVNRAQDEDNPIEKDAPPFVLVQYDTGQDGGAGAEGVGQFTYQPH